MKRLILLRHAKTEAWYDGVDDHSRALLMRGIADVQLVGARLLTDAWRADRALVSTARRARETWVAIAPHMQGTELVLVDDLYLAGPQEIEEVLVDRAGEGTVMVIGHNPGLHDLACQIVRQGGALNSELAARVFDRFPTSCAALFEAENDTGYRATGFKLVDVIRARDLRGQG